MAAATTDAAATSEWNEPVVIRSDMPPDFTEELFEFARKGLSEHELEKDSAMSIKRAMEAKFSGIWHCVVGQHYGCSLTNQTGYVCFFKIAKTGQKPYFIVCFQSLDEEANAVATAPEDEEEEVLESKGGDGEDEGPLEGKDADEQDDEGKD